MRCVILLTTLLFLTACGQKGPLYLEKLDKDVPEETQVDARKEKSKPEAQGQ